MMKYFLIFGLMFWSFPAFSEVITVTEKLELSPTLEDYEKVLEKYKKSIENSLEFKTWEGVELTNKKTKEATTFDKLSEYEKTVFCMMIGDRITNELGLLSEYWNEETAKFKNPDHKIISLDKIENPKQKAASLKDVEKYVGQLQEIRKKFAVKYEKYVEKTMTDFKDKIPEKEREHYLKQVKDYHDKEKLIVRK